MASNFASSIGLLTVPQWTCFSLWASRTTNLSLGERPVCCPVRATSGPSAASCASPRRSASSYSAAGLRFQWTRPDRTMPRASRPYARSTCTVIMLTADAYGVLPPIARLTPEGAMYHFLSGYTARVAGTEKGVTEPKATFSTCFGAPFLPLNPNVYAKMLGERIAKHDARVWLVNTGWTGGPYGVGSRMKIAHTRGMITAALTGQLDNVTYQKHPIFNLDVPTTCPGVPDSVLDPRGTWPDAGTYDEQARKLAGMFVENFKTFEKDVAPSVKEVG